MATKKNSNVSASKQFQPRPKVKRAGIVSKNNTSTVKTSRNYKKPYRGQGR
jgi:hypothetical protein